MAYSSKEKHGMGNVSNWGGYGGSRSTGGPWPVAGLMNTNFKAGGSSQNVAPVMKTGKKNLKGVSKVAPE